MKSTTPYHVSNKLTTVEKGIIAGALSCVIVVTAAAFYNYKEGNGQKQKTEQEQVKACMNCKILLQTKDITVYKVYSDGYEILLNSKGELLDISETLPDAEAEGEK